MKGTIDTPSSLNQPGAEPARSGRAKTRPKSAPRQHGQRDAQGRRTGRPVANRLEDVFAQAAAGMVEYDLTTNSILRVNRYMCTLLGRTEAEFCSGKSGILSHPDDHASHAQRWDEFRRDGAPFEIECRLMHRDGSAVWTRILAFTSEWGADRRPRRLFSIVQDISERKAAEAELIGSQALLRLSLEIGGVGTFRRDYVAGLIDCDAQTRAMHALPPGRDPVPDAIWLETVLPEDREDLLASFARAHARHLSIVTFSYRFLHPQHGIRYAETRSRVTHDKDGRAIASVGCVVDVTDKRQSAARLEHLAHHDPLTDLPNRSLFAIRLQDALGRAARGDSFALLSLDIDHFKTVNDTLGHPGGDALLRMVAGRLRASCRATDTVARLGGDEFAVLQCPLPNPADAEAMAQRLLAVVAAPYDIDGRLVSVAASIGLVIAPQDGTDAGRLLQSVDLALYSAKAAGRACHRAYHPALEDEWLRRRSIDRELREALQTGAFELFYQPIIRIDTATLHGFEALIRWRHPTRGLIMPDSFIPAAESSGLIVPIGAFVLHQACAHAAAWPCGLCVAVNLSAAEFSCSSLVGTVVSALTQSGLAPGRLELEITETAMLAETQAIADMLRQLKALGVRLSMDDFGTGFSSLSYLQRFPFDKVKIDRAFITPLGQTRESLVIVRSICDLCAGLSMQTTAEGVETLAQLETLARFGCTQAQGYHFSPPVPHGDVAGLVARFSPADAGARTPPPF